jgi:hypothetical protein
MCGNLVRKKRDFSLEKTIMDKVDAFSGIRIMDLSKTGVYRIPVSMAHY